MKYNFDVTLDRIHDPYSYSLKYQPYLPQQPHPSMPIDGLSGGVVPEDAIALFHADMDFAIAPKIVEACINATKHPNYGYSAPRRPYYEAVCRWFRVHYDWEFQPEDVYECNGTHAGVCEALNTFTSPGCGVIVFIPSYPFQQDIEPERKYVPIAFSEIDGHYEIDWDTFEAAARKPENEAFILVQPHNPLGFAYSEADMRRMAEICRENDVLMIADLVHLDIHRRDVHPVPLMKAVGAEGVVCLTGLAKTFNISGLCMSNMIVCDPKLKEKLSFRYAALTPFGIAAATAAYTQCDDWVAQLNDYIDELEEETSGFLSANMQKVRFTRPQASYVMYLDFSAYGLNNEQLDARIVGKAHVLLSNGSMFGGENADQKRRLCLTAPKAVVREALQRLSAAFADLE